MESRPPNGCVGRVGGNSPHHRRLRVKVPEGGQEEGQGNSLEATGNLPPREGTAVIMDEGEVVEGGGGEDMTEARGRNAQNLTISVVRPHSLLLCGTSVCQN